MTNTPVFPQTLNSSVQQFLNADGNGAGTEKALFTPGSNGSILDALLVSSSDTSARDLVFGFTVSGTFYVLSTVQIPITAGLTNAIPSVDILRSLQIPGLSYDAFGNRVMIIKNGFVLKAYAGATVTTAKAINVFALGRDF